MLRATIGLLLVVAAWTSPFAHASAHAEARPELRTDLRYYWEGPFSKPERHMLEHWINEVQATLDGLMGPAPFPIHVRFYYQRNADTPIPWANTTRGRRQGVNFYVDPDFPADAFRADWTASHELSHLLIPYLGRQHAWFAEGFASYMQYQVMAAGGMVAADALPGIYRNRFERERRRYTHDNLPFVEAAPRLRAERRYPTMYWGGAIYFWNVDKALRDEGQSLIQLLKRYVACCRLHGHDLEGLIDQLDQLAGMNIFHTTMARFRTEPGFPSPKQ